MTARRPGSRIVESSRGYTLIEVLLVVAILAFVSAGFIFMSTGRKSGQAASMRNAFISALMEAGNLSAGSGNGATIVYVPKGTNASAELAIYSGRPNGGAMGTTPEREVPISGTISNVTGQNAVGTSKFAIFIDGYDRATFGSWQVGEGTISIPSCTPAGAALTITYANGSVALPCGGSTFESDNSNGTQLPT